MVAGEHVVERESQTESRWTREIGDLQVAKAAEISDSKLKRALTDDEKDCAATEYEQRGCSSIDLVQVNYFRMRVQCSRLCFMTYSIASKPWNGWPVVDPGISSRSVGTS